MIPGQPPLFVPQTAPQYPPGFGQPRPLMQPSILPQPLGGSAPPGAIPGGTGPGGAGGGGAIPGAVPGWIPPAPPGPSQSHIPGPIPGFTTNLAGRKLFEFYATPSLTETWTDNFNFTTNHKQENYRTSLGLGGVALVNGATTKASVSSNIAFSHDTVAGSQDYQIFPTVTAAVTQIVSPRLTLTATDSYTRSDQPAQADAFGLNRQRQTFSSNSFGLSANWLIDILATQFYYRNTFFTSNDTDTVSNGFGANASTQIGPLNTARVGYEYSFSSTSSSTTSSTSSSSSSSNTDTSIVGASNSGHSSSHTIYGSLIRQLGAYASAGISSSYTLLSQDNAQIWNVSFISTYGLPSGLSWSSSIGYSLLSSDSQSTTGAVTTNSALSYRFARAVVSLSAFQDYRQTAIEGQNFGIVKTSGFSGSFGYTFTPFLFGNVNAAYTTNSFTGVGNSSSTPNSNTFTAGAGLNWRIVRWLSSSLQYTYSLQSGNNPSSTNTTVSGNGTVTGNGDVTVNTVTLSLIGIF